MKADPNYSELTHWVVKLSKSPLLLSPLLNRWTDLAFDHFDNRSFSDEFLQLNRLLIAFCDHYKHARIDPVPLVRFARQLVEESAARSSPTHSVESLWGLLESAQYFVIGRLRLAVSVATGNSIEKPKLNETDRRVLSFVKDNGPVQAKGIAHRLDMREDGVRRIISTKLVEHYGVQNIRGEGYVVKDD